MRLAEKMAVHTAGPWLPGIQAPTLVVAGERDIFTPLYLSEEAADRLPRARLLVLREGSHAALVEQPDEISHQLDQFLSEFHLAGLPLETRGAA
jgi:pimeloyl-ACP methyl ester carboxylesterase